MSRVAEKITIGSVIAVVLVALLSKYEVFAAEQSGPVHGFIVGLV